MAKKPPSRTTRKFKDVSEMMGAIKRKHGDESITLIGSSPIIQVPTISTGAMTLDAALGVWGIPRGRVIEVYGVEGGGKTTLALSIIKQAQKQGGIAAFVDAEHSLDPVWARNIGVNVDELMVSQPNCGEEALDIVETLAGSGQVDLVVVDSVAALTPQCEIDGEIGESHIGAHARLMSQALRKLVGVAKKAECAVVFINQIRMKIGVMFGCLHGDTPINFVDGRAISIKKVVEDKIEGDVWSYNQAAKEFRPRRITGWHHNGLVKSAEDYLCIMAIGPGNRNGQMTITTTKNHKIMTNHGWTKASDLTVGSRIMTKYESIMNGGFGQFMYGVLAGDSHISQGPAHLNASLKIRDNIDLAYAEWKVAKLKDLDFTRQEYGNRVQFESAQFTDLALHKQYYPNRDPMGLLNNFSWVGMAVWLMDDAVYERSRYQLSIKRFKGNHQKIEQISRALDKLGLYHYASAGGLITFDRDVSDRIAKEIRQYVPKCMNRKLPESLHGSYHDFDLKLHRKLEPTFATVWKIRNASAKQMRNRGKYDISVSDDCCYLAGGRHNGLLVHNSPETTPGGRALKFYASVRLDVRRQAAIKEGDENIGNIINIRVVKNKVAPPFKSAICNLYFGKNGYPHGIDYVGSVLNFASDLEILEKSGSWYAFENQRIGNGFAAACKFLRDNENVLAQIESKVKSKIDAPVKLAPEDVEDVEDVGFDETDKAIET